MFYDLIYTRCRRGVDILRNGQPVLSDGFKVYSCSSDIYKNNLTDLPFLMSMIQGKQSFKEPDFMEDAYLYYVPATGKKFLNSFHPVPYDLSVTGDFAKRPGMYLNHAIVSDYDAIYPFELFGDSKVWTGELNNEAYYYEVEPKDMPPRDLSDRGDFHARFEAIGRFVQDGREDALKRAVAFLINEFEQPADKRKYLVIKDDSAKNIENWIAAIELSFSPRIASGIPFATRMDRYANTNLYYANKDGTFAQQQSNNANTVPQLRSMIVGVLTKDRTNSVRIFDGAPYVVLDGTKKEISYDADVSSHYYQLICSYNEAHERFSKDFLQSLEIYKPEKSVISIAKAFYILCCGSNRSPKDYARALACLSSFKMNNTPIMASVYRKVNGMLDEFVKDNIEDTLPVLQWVSNAAGIFGDEAAQSRLSDIISRRAKEVFFTGYEKNGFEVFWEKIKDGPFEKQIHDLLNDEPQMVKFSKVVRGYEPEDAALFAEIYCHVCADAVKAGEDKARLALASCAAACAKDKESEAINGVFEAVKGIKEDQTLTFLFDSVQEFDKSSFGAFITALYWNTPDLHSDVKAILRFCKLLADYGKADGIGSVLGTFATETNSLKILEVLAEQMPKMDFIPSSSKAKAFTGIDSRVSFDGKISEKLVELIQDNRPADCACPNSAHVCALMDLQRMSRRDRASDILEPYVQQGFPSVDDEKYTQALAKTLCKLKLSEADRDYIVELLANSADVYYGPLLSALIGNAPDSGDLLDAAICFAANSRSKKLRESISDILVNVLTESGLKKRNMEAISKLLSDRNAVSYYLDAVETASQNSGRGDSFATKLFGGFRK